MRNIFELSVSCGVLKNKCTASRTDILAWVTRGFPDGFDQDRRRETRVDANKALYNTVVRFITGTGRFPSSIFYYWCCLIIAIVCYKC